ncbi:MAG TPA: Ppx/GppA phosphatase family protein, partial [Pirellulales bacterium]|nr:Ppx/GppA phosphatase family protein [Pirellulales bacterium]
ELAHRLAAIDIGSNSVRLMVAEPMRGGNYRILDEEREATRLGRTLSSTGRLDPQAMALSLAALRRFKQITDGFQVAELRTIATCAVREATNGPEFCRRAKEELGIDIDVISAEKEARLAFFSVQRAFDLSGKNVVVADIGGGSTEIILASGNLIEATFTTPLGAVRLTEIYGNGNDLDDPDLEKLAKAIDQQLRRLTKKPFFAPHFLIGSGGTFTSLAEMIMASKGQVGLPTRGYNVTHAEVSHLLDRLRKMPLKARRGVPGLSPDRADIIIAGLTIVDRIMRQFQVNLLQVHNRGVRDGLILTMIDQNLGAPSQDPHDRDAAVERFAATSSGELAHGRQVARLAGRIFAQLAATFGMNAGDQSLLETAARLQDVGYLINYEKHHKHSYHLILNSGLPGFQPRELELIANVARYHRGAKPKRKHDNFRQLSAEDQQRVRQLAAILRLAGGLDRSHSGQVRDVLVEREGDGRLTIEVVAPENPDVDIWSARRRGKMFAKVFKTPLSIRWQGQNQAAADTDTSGATAQAG